MKTTTTIQKTNTMKKTILTTAFAFAVLFANAQLYVTTGNNVGIGTSGPTAPLELSGNNTPQVLKITSTWATGGQSNLTLNGGSGGLGQVINNYGDFYVTNGSSTGALILRTNTAERLRITSAGNVGINTTSPGTFQLNVNGTTACTGNVWTSDKIFKTNIAAVS